MEGDQRQIGGQFLRRTGKRVDQTARRRRKLRVYVARVIPFQQQGDGAVRKHQSTAGPIGRVQRDCKLKIRAVGRAGDLPPQVTGAARVKGVGHFLVAAAPLNHHLRANASHTEPRCRIVVGVDKEVVEGICKGVGPGRVESASNVKIGLIVGNIDVLVLDGIGRSRCCGIGHRHAGPIAKRAIDGDMFESAWNTYLRQSTDAPGACQHCG